MAKKQRVRKYVLEHFIPLRIVLDGLGLSWSSLTPVDLQLGLFCNKVGIDIAGSSLSLINQLENTSVEKSEYTYRFRISVVPRKMQS